MELALGLRALHLLAAATVVGLSAACALRGRGGPREEALLWVSLALLVLGGVANLGNVGAPPAGSVRGILLTVKLVVLAALLVTAAARVLGRPERPLWAANAVLAALALVAAVGLAHG